jgi:hypothetical protein
MVIVHYANVVKHYTVSRGMQTTQELHVDQTSQQGVCMHWSNM